MLSYVQSTLRIDIRSLALFRILLGFALLWDLIRYKAGLFKLLLSPDHAMFSVDSMHHFFGLRANSLFDVLGTDIAVSGFLVFAGLVYVLLILGYRTRIVSIFAFFCYWNLAQRISIFYNPAEMLTGSLLFIGMFLPLDRAIAIRRTGDSISGTSFYSPFSLLILFQLALVYFMMAVVRLEPELLGGNSTLNYFRDMIYLRPWVSATGMPWFAGRAILYAGIMLCLAVPAGIFWPGRSVFGKWVAFFSIGILALVKLTCTWSGNWFLISLASMALILPAQAWKISHVFGTNPNSQVLRRPFFWRWMHAAALLMGLLLLHQNLMTLTAKPGLAARLMKKTKLTRIIKVTQLPRIENASLFNQNWIRSMPAEGGRYGEFKVEAASDINRKGNTSRRRFRSYCSSGLTVWRNEMSETDIQDLLINWLQFESTGGNESHPAIYYEDDSEKILMLGKHKDWYSSEWTPPVYYYNYKGPVEGITQGYGSPGPYTYKTFQKEHHGSTMMVYVPVTDEPVPVVLFTHAFFGHNYQIYKSLMEHVVSWGYAFAFVPYRKGELNKDAGDRRLRYGDVWEGFNDVMTSFPEMIDRSKVVVAGHSYGGGGAASLAVKIFSETTWGNEAGGIAYFCPGYMEDIFQEDLESLRGDIQLMAQVYEMDTVTGAGMAWDFYENAGIDDSNKIFLVLEPDEVDGYSYLANHYVPLQIGPNQYFDAYDYYGVFRPFNAFLLSVFDKDEKAYEFLYGEEHPVLDMGPRLKPMRLMTEFEPLQVKEWYWAPCDHPGNPRREFCP